MGPSRIRSSGARTALLITLTIVSASSGGGSADRLLGKWYTEGRRAIFEFYRAGDEFKARLIPLEKPNIIDSLNPIDSLKPRRLAGATTIFGLVYNSSKQQWEDGRVYNPSDGKTYNCHCKIRDGDLIFRGYLGISLLGQSQTWTRVPPDEEPVSDSR